MSYCHSCNNWPCQCAIQVVTPAPVVVNVIPSTQTGGLPGFSTQGIQGVQGVQGGQGTQGIHGQYAGQGVQGSQGLQGGGFNQAQGTQGLQGIQGFYGLQGSSGHNGVQGYTGAQGKTGTQGTQGLSIQGNAGTSVVILGSYPTYAALVAAHPTGNNGDGYIVDPYLYVWEGGAWVNVGIIQGPQGTQGTQGLQGVQGTQGLQGTQGTQGLQGPQGTQGIQGVQGPQGTQGTQGLQGVQGTQGTQGVQGTQGIQGRSYLGVTSPTPNAVTTGSLTFNVTNSGAFGLGQTVRVSNTPGLSNWVEGIITAITLDSSITVNSILTGGSGTYSQWTFSTAGVQGLQGPQGTQGIQGPQGTQGIQGIQGLQGVQGTQGIQGPQGTTGIQGIQGPQGTQGIQGVQGTQGIQGRSFIGVTSATSFLIGTGSKAFTVTNSGAYTVGQYVVVTNTGTPTNFMFGQITALTTDSSITVNVTGTGGSGTFAAWTFNVSGLQGTQGVQGPQGTQGIQGPQGTQGIQGLQGVQGVQGPQGTTGIQGAQGTQGFLGLQGSTGTQGTTGMQGATGTQGLVGLQGTQGIQGTQGVQGNQGIQGNQGTTGLQGIQGNQGTTGLQGLIGLQGLQGNQGTQGVQGTQGTTGIQGITGTGTQGIQGNTGIQGSFGVQGTQGVQGLVGPLASNNAHASARMATTANLAATYTAGTLGADGGYGVGATLTATSNGRGSVDGVSFTTNDRVLVKNQTTTTQNGIYVITQQGSGPTPYILTRASDYNNSVNGEVEYGDFLYVVAGTTQSSTNWIENSVGSQSNGWIIIGTDAITFAQTGGIGPQGTQGSTGATGAQGIQGTTGIQGAVGTQGAIGTTGSTGAQGTTGAQGITGSTGIQGTQGTNGLQGLTGLQGLQGNQGTTGLQGFTGTQGTAGTNGANGAQGTTGSQGLTGIQGATGTQGFVGLQGLIGLQGFTGSQGTTGTQGTQGLQGLQGTQGVQGTQGIQVQGTQGTQGIQGPQGTQGIQGTQGNQGTQGLQGLQGTQGIQGNQGTIGTTGIATATAPITYDGVSTIALNVGTGLTTSASNLIVDTTVVPELATTNTFTAGNTIAPTATGVVPLTATIPNGSNANMASFTQAGTSYALTVDQFGILKTLYGIYGGTTAPYGARNNFGPNGSTSIIMALRSSSAQSGDMLQNQNGSGTVISGFNAAGQLFAGNTTAVVGSITTAISSAAYTSATVAVFTYGGTSLIQVGQKVTIAGVTGGTYNGTWIVTAATSTTFTVVGSGFTNVAGTGGTAQISAVVSVVAPTAAITPIVVQANASQTANLTEWQNSSGTPLAKIDSRGNLTATSYITSGGTSSQFVKGDGSLDTSTTQVTPLDNLQYSFDGVENRFIPTYQGAKQTITNPLRLLVTINGIVQTVNYSSVVWDSPLPWDGFRVDDDGYIAFSESVPAGSQFSGRIMAGTDTPTVTTTYPFSPTDLLLGAF